MNARFSEIYRTTLRQSHASPYRQPGTGICKAEAPASGRPPRQGIRVSVVIISRIGVAIAIAVFGIIAIRRGRVCIRAAVIRRGCNRFERQPGAEPSRAPTPTPSMVPATAVPSKGPRRRGLRQQRCRSHKHETECQSLGFLHDIPPDFGTRRSIGEAKSRRAPYRSGRGIFAFRANSLTLQAAQRLGSSLRMAVGEFRVYKHGKPSSHRSISSPSD